MNWWIERILAPLIIRKLIERRVDSQMAFITYLIVLLKIAVSLTFPRMKFLIV